MKYNRKSLFVAASVFLAFAAFGAAPGEASVCSQLRAACVHKDRLGEQGAGNCERYRATCQSRRTSCSRLRYQCMNKESLGLTGAGVCETYRSNCR